MKRMVLQVLMVAAMSIILGACNKSPVGPSPMPPNPPPDSGKDPNIPPPGLDTSWKQLADGVGNPGPLWMRLLWVDPAPGGTLMPPRYYAAFKAEFCMGSGHPVTGGGSSTIEPVPNPNNNPNLAGMHIAIMPSRDGVLWDGRTVVLSSDGTSRWNVPNGGCIFVYRLPVELGGHPGNQFLGFSPGAPYLLATGEYGINDGTYTVFFSNPPAECPSPNDIPPTAKGIGCDLRSSHFLDYKWQ